MKREIPCTICGSEDHVAASCTSPMAARDGDHMKSNYANMVKKGEKLLGSERALCRALGLQGHGALHYRLAHPDIIRYEHILALENLINRIERRE